MHVKLFVCLAIEQTAEALPVGHHEHADLHRLSADGDKKCRLQVEYTLVYITSVNAFIKKAIERGELFLCEFACSV